MLQMLKLKYLSQGELQIRCRTRSGEKSVLQSTKLEELGDLLTLASEREMKNLEFDES